MSIDLYWGSGSPFSWRVLLALELKKLPYANHLLQFSKQEHKSPQMLSLNFRGRVPVLKDGDYVVFESLAVLFYLDRNYKEFNDWFHVSLKRMPSEYVLDHVLFGMVGDAPVLKMGNVFPLDRLIWGSDFPNSFGTYPN